jgi:hypothetical protein
MVSLPEEKESQSKPLKIEKKTRMIIGRKTKILAKK